MEIEKCQNKAKPGHVKESLSLDDLDECVSKSRDFESCQSCSEVYGGPAECPEYRSDMIELTHSLDSLDEEPMTSTVVKRNVFQESHSLDLLDDSKKISRQHARNKSVSMTSHQWSKSVDVLSKGDMDRQRIDAQLECYDEALRELAEEQKVKQQLLNKVFDLSLRPTFDTVKLNLKMQSKPSISPKELYTKVETQCSDDESNCSQISNKIYNHLHKSNTIDAVNSKCSQIETLSENNVGNTNIIPLECNTIKFEQDQLVDLDQKHTVRITKHISPSQEENCHKQKSCKLRSSSVSCKSKRHSFDGKHKFFNSLELPSRCKRTKEYNSKPRNKQMHNTLCNEVRIGTDCVWANGNCTGTEFKDSPKPPPRVKKLLKKEHSDSDLRIKSHSKEGIKPKVGRSISLYMERMNTYDTLEKKQFDCDDLFICEKSESDSDWSERTLHNKRQQFSAMRGLVADSEDSNEEDPPFWFNTGKSGSFSRQDTVIHNEFANEINTTYVACFIIGYSLIFK